MVLRIAAVGVLEAEAAAAAAVRPLAGIIAGLVI
jgi:hypothetical protein